MLSAVVDLTQDEDDGESARPSGEPLRKVRKTVGSSSPGTPPAVPPPSPISPPVTPPATPPAILPNTPPATPPAIPPGTLPVNQSAGPSTSGASSQQPSPDTTVFYAKLINRFRQPRYKGYCFIAHYASRFDSFLILEYFCKAGITIEIIMQGCKLMFMYDETFAQRYIDSYSFFPFALAKMPAALDLTTTEKGYFPHLFNRVENENYFGPYPDKKFYNYDNMSDKDREKFDAWYSTVEGTFFDFKKELYAYGVNDVVLLREGCMKYRESFVQCTELDPFAFTTIASCSMGVFKTHYLDRNTLALTHNKAYVHQNKSYSSGSIEWLEYVKKTRNVDVHHAVNHGEVSIGKYFLDGYYEQDDVRHGLEYAGCIFHGHCCRFEPHQTHPLSGVPYGVLRNQFDDKVEILRNAYGL
ncbi:unnamed protein product [Leuciscus chuanchicus]